MRHLKLIFILISMFFLTSCGIDDGNIKEKIDAPNNINPPIEGKWIIENYIADDSQKDLNIEKIENFVGMEGLFHKDAFVLGDNFSLEPSFKLKKVKAYDYLLYKYKKDPKSLGIEDTQIKIITISNQNQLIYEFIKLDEDNILLYMEDVFFKLEKVADQVSMEEINRYINIEETMQRSVNSIDTKQKDSGILLGIKTPNYDEDKDIPNWEYKTIWISRQKEDRIKAYELEGLLLPRKNGFYLVDMEREINEDFVRDKVSLSPYLEKNEKKQNEVEYKLSRQLSNRKNSSILRNILFVGSDYISIENIELKNKNKKTLEIYALDNLENNKPIKLSDILGEEGRDVFEKEAENLLPLDVKSKIDEKNVGLVRRNGYWIINGRVNYIQNEEELYKDFNVKAIPPKEIISFDELAIPWNKLKLKFPEIVDVFSSPNEDFMIIVKKDKLIIYEIENNTIKLENPLREISIKNNSSIVMSEWALGKYTDRWENMVIKNEGELIKRQ